MDKQDQKALNDIEEYGCHIINVMEGDNEPSFTYSIGINQKQNKPDLIIVGLKRELAHSIVNNYKDRLLAGETFETGQYYSDFLGGFDVFFIEVDKSHYKEYLGWGLWLNNGDDFKMLQLIWPTTDGVWPWDSDKSEFYEWAQPILNDAGELSKI
ncbi:hypothetical protein DS2_16689 [Catenovulum agarivorans DS-2]|uniref:DUF4262 domain-containing protein n=1 Tax=Catenovulum agarivorans DS-2 TaxID=1328313 RepID=W7QI67_9ALTE|nr:DUF4262 domain-containing protein [Catenovulum agarivorans]EWH08602.1 hypothetical protein DS2_16689 [Catenovulum agarivorans DS-2]